MASLGDSRRESGQANIDARRASGRAMVEERNAIGRSIGDGRRASGQANIDARRASGKALRDDMRALAEDSPEKLKLPDIAPRGSMPSQRSVANFVMPIGSSGGGIASPLTEVEAGAGNSSREYYHDNTVYFYSSDYTIAVEIRPLKTLRMIDANGDMAEFQFKLPPPSEAP